MLFGHFSAKIVSHARVQRYLHLRVGVLNGAMTEVVVAAEAVKNVDAVETKVVVVAEMAAEMAADVAVVVAAMMSTAQRAAIDQKTTRLNSTRKAVETT